MSEESPTGTCALCGATVPMELLFGHLEEHGLHPERDLLRWPDGSPVIVDETLEPGDFE